MNINKTILRATKAPACNQTEHIQDLWSGYGSIERYELIGSRRNSVIVKHVKLPTKSNHPRGWDTGLSHSRKIKSYEVEMAWYKTFSSQCNNNCRMPEPLALEKEGEEILMVLEDLDSSGFPARKSQIEWKEVAFCISWLAHFHATFMGTKPKKLWTNGSYWHLDTRPDELKALADNNLKKAAHSLDLKLKKCQYKTLIHGDAKLANFCFSGNGSGVAAVDFQYVGGGCGMKDLAYFIGSCYGEDDCEQLESQILDTYFDYLKTALESKNSTIDIDSLEQEWRLMYPIAWTDFHRFIKGWSPGHWKINSYSERVSQEVIKNL